jgi:hypothetical protein
MADIMGETLTGPAVSGSGYKFYGCQYTDGKVYLIFEDNVKILRSSSTYLNPTNYAIEWGNTWNGLLDELYIEPNVVIEEDLPVYPPTGFPQDIGRWRFNESYGNYVNPAMPLQPRISLTNTTWNTTNKNSVIFNGSNSYGTATIPVITGQSELTIEILVKFSSVGAAQTLLDQTNGLNLSWNATGVVANLYGPSAGTSVIYTWVPTLNTWYLVSLVYDGAKKYIYINGQLAGSIASTGTYSTAATLYIGRTVAGSQYFNGQIGYLAITRTIVRPYTRPFPSMIVGKHGFDGKTEWML